MTESKFLKLIDVTTTPCPFCAGTFTAGTNEKTGNGVAIHSMPMCETFNRLDPLAFLLAVNARLASRT